MKEIYETFIILLDYIIFGVMALGAAAIVFSFWLMFWGCILLTIKMWRGVFRPKGVKGIHLIESKDKEKYA